MPDDHSEVVPLLPIPNRTVKRFSADDSADSRVKVGHCQAIKVKTPSHSTGRFFWPFFWFLHQICDAAILDLAWPPTPCAHPISSVFGRVPFNVRQSLFNCETRTFLADETRDNPYID